MTLAAMEMDQVIDKKPLVFFLRGKQPDVRLRVFDDEYHVHSQTLKDCSAYFYKFLDSPEKQGRVSSTFRFKYEWVTRVDDDGSWSLESVGFGNQNLQPVFAKTKDNTEQQKQLFHNLMCAFYRLTYGIKDVGSLIMLTELADYYCALRTLSSSVLGAISVGSNSFGCLVDFWTTDELLTTLFKLRRGELFNDCIITIAGDWYQGNYAKRLAAQPPKLQNVVEYARSQICCKIAAAQQEFLHKGSHHIEYRRAVLNIRSTAAMPLPTYYRKMADLAVEHIGSLDSMPALTTLLSKDFVNITVGTEAGSGYTYDHFLCGRVMEKDLPWDVNEKDW